MMHWIKTRKIVGEIFRVDVYAPVQHSMPDWWLDWMIAAFLYGHAREREAERLEMTRQVRGNHVDNVANFSIRARTREFLLSNCMPPAVHRTWHTVVDSADRKWEAENSTPKGTNGGEWAVGNRLHISVLLFPGGQFSHTDRAGERERTEYYHEQIYYVFCCWIIWFTLQCHIWMTKNLWTTIIQCV